MTRTPVRAALLSVFDKTGITDLAAALHGHGIKLISTGGTARTIRKAGLPVTDVKDITEFPEIMAGRVKTLHPKIHGGLLARPDLDDQALAEHNIGAIDLLVVNLYRFAATLAAGGSEAEVVEMIDIGGPAMVRAAAKNHTRVGVLTDAAQYPDALAAIAAGGLTRTLRLRWAAAAFAHTARYDAGVADWMEQRVASEAKAAARLPTTLRLMPTRTTTLRYGENPHQAGALYLTADARPVGFAALTQLQGKELSYNNIADTDVAYRLALDLIQPACVIVKHGNPCGVAVADQLLDAYRLALRCDPVSAFGGVIAFNRPLDAATVAQLTALFTEVIVAPAVTDDAAALCAKKKNLRLLTMPARSEDGLTVRQVLGGWLVQDADTVAIDAAGFRVVTQRPPTDAELSDMRFAMTVTRRVASNAIVLVKNGATVGIGAGQMSRVDSTIIAARKAAEAATAAGLPRTLASGAIAASDAFFPFADAIDQLIAAGVTAVVQPGGSLRDDTVIAAADAVGLAMVFTGQRHFRH
jgi:phosphoribosylaminoimidazolecarboxamide formyltransferase/IMP cyclohydrolase